MDLVALLEADEQKGINVPDEFVFGHAGMLHSGQPNPTAELHRPNPN
jgi:hypothetical protein